MNKGIHTSLEHISRRGKIFFAVAISISCPFIAPVKAIAQTDTLSHFKGKTDINKKGGFNLDEIKIDKEAVKLIKFDFMPSLDDDSNKPLDAPMEKSWMKFKQDFDVPISLTDTTKVRKPEGYIRMLPYSIWTKFGEDPVYDVMVFGKKKKEYKMTWAESFNPFRDYGDNYGLSIAPSAGIISDGMRIIGPGFAIKNLDIIGFIYNNFTKRGRMLQHNKKHANAWKIYAAYQPTLSDSLKFPTFYNGLAAPIFTYNPKDSIHTASTVTPYEELPDSVKAEIELVLSVQRDSLRKEYLERENAEADKERKPKHVKRSTKRKVREAKEASKRRKQELLLKEKEEKMIEELQGSMDDLYKYMREKKAREAEAREKARKEKEMEIKEE